MTFYKKSDLENLPSSTGIYIFKKKNKIIYIGKSINIKARIKSHFENARIDNKERKIIENFDLIQVITTDFEFNALLLESQLISKYKPFYNVRWKDDKSYIYIKVVNIQNFYKVFITRKEKDKKSLYFGPFPSVRTTEYLLSQIRRIFPYCSQKKLTNKPCFYSKLGLCDPCPSFINQLSNQKEKTVLLKTYNKNIFYIKQILNGKNKLIEKHLIKKISQLTEKENYEEAIKYRNRLFLFQKLINMNVFSNTETDYKVSNGSLQFLTNFLKKYFPELKTLKRIECYDLSNISFEYSTGSMVVAINGELDKSQYKKFKIKRKDNKSDLYMLEEVLNRRFKNKWTRPNLIIVDGGTPQVITALKIIKKFKIKIPLIGIAKHPDRLVIGSYGLPKLTTNLTNPKFSLLVVLRDEAHRFAKKYHLYLRNLKLENLRTSNLG
jgi:excinuclease ABC subunit C